MEDPSLDNLYALSFISIDIDKHSEIAAKYGNRIARDVSQQVGRNT